MSQTVLVVAAHPDDEVLGCGGTMRRHADAGDRVVCLILGEGITSRHDSRSGGLQSGATDLEKLHSDSHRAMERLGVARLELAGLPDNRFDSMDLLDVVKVVEKVFDEEKPSIVYAHHAGDVNIDHLVTHRAVLAACRQLPGTPLRELYFYEVPSSTEWQTPALACPFVPNHFVNIAATLDAKVAAMEEYKSESRGWPHPRSPQALRALAQWRGATIGTDAAEAFVVGRIVKY
ncbi:PIG-L family deacetylase [bacterium]|nr:PIG-L family deacetylase [bacterium]